MKLIPKIILIGCGPHAKRVYIPALELLVKSRKVELKLVVDLIENEENIKSFLKEKSIDCETIFCHGFISQSLPSSLADKLNNFCKENNINGVIIATEPLSHRAYAEWALKIGLNILMDKPFSSRNNCVSDLIQAKGIKEDFDFIHDLYIKNLAKYNNIFIINTQRRFHPCFDFVLEKINEIKDLTKCPVTSIEASHCDGQWRLPSEIVTQHYHPYNSGYGKASHSGYHIFDMVYRLYSKSVVQEKCADEINIVSSFIQPLGFLKQFDEDDYKRLFGNSKYDSVKKWSDNELYTILNDYGEMDLSTIVTLKKDNVAIGNITINLLHNGFARRTWLNPGDDLYKGNGRVKHEHYSIQQGPFQNIQIHSYQSKDKHNAMSDIEDYWGGNNHFDVLIYRNPLVCENDSSMQKFSMQEILNIYKLNVKDKLVTESVKYNIVQDFVRYLNNELSKDDIDSKIDDHQLPVKIMSGAYQSHILRNRDENPIIKYSFF